ncbi:MAG: TIGR00366 family protein [Sulfolobales archaeon]
MAEEAATEKMPLLERFGLKLSEKVEKVMPDPLIFAILLTIITWILAIVVIRPYEKMGVIATIQWLFVDSWYRGFWDLLAFAMQMALILVTGYAIAYHPVIYRGVKRLARIPKSTKSAAALTALVSLLLAWLHWGLSLILSAILAREIGLEFYRNKRPLHYPAVVASAYAGLGLNWHWGLSASAPLISNTPGHFFAKLFKDLYGVETIPLSETIFHPYTLANMILIIVFGTLAFYAVAPRNVSRGVDVVAPHVIEVAVKEGEEARKPEIKTIADRLENSRILALLIGIPALIAMWFWFSRLGFFRGLDLNSLNFIFILAGFLLYLNPIAYMRAIARATPAVAGILIQFPFYAGIMGLMRYTTVDGGPNLATVLSVALAQLATPVTWPAINLYLSGFINLFIPSGGGEWAAIGEIITRTSHQLGVPIGKAIIAYAAGDQWTNLFQPFWAIPLLAITGTRARDVFGYTIAVMILATIPFSLGLVLIPY